jgi:subtilisin family serine protease
MGVNRIGLVLLLMLGVIATEAQNRYMVFFKDKANTPFSISEQGQFLSARAIARRIHHNVTATEQDLPVDPDYILGVKNTGAQVFFQTRWMNGVLVQCNEDLVATIEGLSYVEKVEFVAPNPKLVPQGRRKNTNPSRSGRAQLVTDDQLQMLDIDKMHADGYLGQGIVIAVLDAGFSGVDSAPAFQHLFNNNQIDLTVSQDFVYNSEDLFQYDDHGTFVFSTLAAFDPGSFTGSAHKATFQLYVTEESPTEYRVEEYNWLFAAERADSAGADIIQASLGYGDFDGTAMDYSKSQLNGSITIVSKAAQWAADRGMLIVCSAGNEGNNSWQTITSPADALDVLAVANVNREGERAASSSIGPSADQRIKPDVAALGTSTSVIQPNGGVGTVSGTSLAAPLVTGLVAGIWQRFPHLTNRELIDAVRKSASQASSPDNFLGYGIPSYTAVVNYVANEEQKSLFAVFPNPFDTLTIKPRNPDEVQSCTIELITDQGRSLFFREITFSWNQFQYETSLRDLPEGIYFLRILHKGKTFIHKLVKI